MKLFLAMSCVIFLTQSETISAYPKTIVRGARRCVNLWDEGCINGQLPGAGNDDNFLNGDGFNPGKRCINVWDEGCNNGPMVTEGDDNNFGAELPPGRRFLYELLEKIQRKHQLY